ncbi:MAG: 4Fe-4S binding protein, partial [Eubacteriales bacterium]|nr:4Fe-4S binding protein [Eubacteriales bacterium]MDD4584158.1 4Fe-4S binding protein [Eubacteriales bacterium]
LGIRKGDNFGTKEEMADAIKNAANKGQGVFAMKALGGGVLTASYQEAMRYVMKLPGISSIMLGFGNRNEVDRAIEFTEGTLDADYTPDLSKKKIWIDQGDCEGCGACFHRCPNHAIYLNDQGLANVKYELCLTCGYCAPVCPVRAIIMLG